ncbi:sulfurtransferase complex subunit TusB [Affinibrenneria salicis]|uniref:Protein TusB n=1 Tax=Affinibrenneria salicis TaxID=2590031 RepID=A0A5J5FT83_9GAMM|nr:sulfurtransferase complex subunit TusB [Affinibrenneria salicis]KAA8996344.1 sulfurtransferase complex subunit TusB [Affinibrenneria salicis]
MLHTLSRSPWQCDIATIVRCLGASDEILLLQDAVVAAIDGGAALSVLLSRGLPLYALREDAAARGIIEQISTKVALISYTDFVGLTVRHSQQMAW